MVHMNWKSFWKKPELVESNLDWCLSLIRIMTWCWFLVASLLSVSLLTVCLFRQGLWVASNICNDLVGRCREAVSTQGIIGPVRADCLCYESYRLDKVERIHSPITTFRGGNDLVTSPNAFEMQYDATFFNSFQQYCNGTCLRNVCRLL